MDQYLCFWIVNGSLGFLLVIFDRSWWFLIIYSLTRTLEVELCSLSHFIRTFGENRMSISFFLWEEMWYDQTNRQTNRHMHMEISIVAGRNNPFFFNSLLLKLFCHFWWWFPWYTAAWRLLLCEQLIDGSLTAACWDISSCWIEIMPNLEPNLRGEDGKLWKIWSHIPQR